jgi:hypothetical protein
MRTHVVERHHQMEEETLVPTDKISRPTFQSWWYKKDSCTLLKQQGK